MSENTVELNFFGNVYYLKDKDGEVSTREVVNFVQQIIDETIKQNHNLLQDKQIIIAFLKLGKDCLKFIKEKEKLEEEINKLTAKLLSNIDNALKD